MSEVEQMMAGPDDDGLASGEHILVVDDDPFIARLLEIELQASGYDVAVAGDGKQALDQVAERIPPVLADVMMPNMDGLELTKRLREDPTTSSVSVILLTARGLSADKLEGFAVGADDYIVKPFDTPELLARIRGVLRRAKEMRAQSPLTELPGNVRIEEEIERRVAERQVFAILYVDLDHFKSYNDHYGFMRGDQVIQFASRLLQDVAVDIAGRMRSWATSGATTSSSFAGASTRSPSRSTTWLGSTRISRCSTTMPTASEATSRWRTGAANRSAFRSCPSPSASPPPSADGSSTMRRPSPSRRR